MITQEGFIYILAISLQLAGAELLIMSYWSKPIAKLQEEELNKEAHIDGETIVLDSRTKTEIVGNIWLNRFAFLMIAIGYVVGIFGGLQNCCKWFVAFWVLVVSVEMACVANWAANRICVKRKG